MSDELEIEALIARMARDEPIDWDLARARLVTGEARARLEALEGIARIAAFSHEHWEWFSSVFDTRTGDGAGTADADAPAEPVFPTGGVIGAYTLDEQIGEGGMSSVWLAHRSDGRFESKVAVKFMQAPWVGRGGLARFTREGHLLARLVHPNIARLLDAGVTADGQPYLVLEYVDGLPIDRYCAEQNLDLVSRIRLFLAVLGAVAHAQANLVLHRDLKPSNILVDRAGTVKLLDFGVGKLLDEAEAEAGETALTRRAGRILTPEFAAPEQLLSAPVTTATDVYGAGVVLYELLTGRHPTTSVGGSPLERMRAILETTPAPASEVVRGIPVADVATSARRDAARRSRALRGDLDNILAKALKKDPAERYPNAAAFAADLRRHLAQEPVTARADSARYRAGKFVSRHRTAVTAGAIALAALVGLTAFSLTQAAEARRQRDEAHQQTQLAAGFNTLITSVLSQVGPNGEPLAPEELLDRAVAEVLAQYGDSPRFLVDMLIRISGRYLDLGDRNREYAALAAAEAAARRAQDPRLIFEVQVNTVETALALGRVDDARQRIIEARALLPELDPVPREQDYLRAEAEVARADGDYEAAIGYLESACRYLRETDDTGGNVYPGVLSFLRLCYATAGDPVRAHACANEMVALHERYNREESAAGTIARIILAMSCSDIGEIRRARDIFEEAIPDLKDPAAPPPPTWGRACWFYGDIVSRLGHDARAIALIDGAIAEVRRGGDATMEMRARLALARSLLRAQRLGEAAAALDSVEIAIAADTTANRVWLAESERLRAELALSRHEPDAALRKVDGALQRLGYPDARRSLGLAPALLTRARVRFARGEAGPARESSLAAAHLFARDSVDSLLSANYGEAMAVAARAALAALDTVSARAELALAQRALASGLGPEHGATREVADMAARLDNPPSRR